MFLAIDNENDNENDNVMAIKSIYLFGYYDYSKKSKIISNLLPFFWLIYLFFCFAY